jgi:hypothetical protein
LLISIPIAAGDERFRIVSGGMVFFDHAAGTKESAASGAAAA